MPGRKLAASKIGAFGLGSLIALMKPFADVTPSFGKEPNASHMCTRIKFHTYDRRYKCIPETMS
jgi:hypothetical protein